MISSIFSYLSGFTNGQLIDQEEQGVDELPVVQGPEGCAVRARARLTASTGSVRRLEVGVAPLFWPGLVPVCAERQLTLGSLHGCNLQPAVVHDLGAKGGLRFRSLSPQHPQPMLDPASRPKTLPEQPWVVVGESGRAQRPPGGEPGEEFMMTTNHDKLKPGNTAPKSGQYEEVGPRGGSTGHEVTGVKGKTLPPTTQPGHSYELVDPTKNKSGK